MVSFLSRQGDQLVAEELAVSHWAPTQLNGPVVCGLLARELETHCPAGFVPARMTVDLFRPVLNAHVEVRSEVVRQGKRIAVVDASIVQEGQVRVRASVAF